MVRDLIPVTCPRRTVVDLADISSPREVERVLDEAASLTASGWRVVRITWRRLRSEPAAVAAQLSGLLAPH